MESISKTVAHIAPDGIDFYFDNIGGKTLDEMILYNMKKFGTVIMCGALDNYNGEGYRLKYYE